jgi:aspartate-semialdehyde dehydrogenase
VAVLGATGLVGQRLVTLLEDHPWFRLEELGASPRSAGRAYREVVRWSLNHPLPELASRCVLRACTPREIAAPLVFSALDASVAGEVEASFAGDGRWVISNCRNHRLDENVPLVVPEVNADHLAILDRRDRAGGIVANPNCTTVGLALALAPLHTACGVKAVSMVSMQALSGAGLPGHPAVEALGNVLPHIPGEEEKVVRETHKILGRRDGHQIEPARFPVSAACHRVPVRDGHLLVVAATLAGDPPPARVAEILEGFTGAREVQGLPTAPLRPIQLRLEPERPQPYLDRGAGGGMTVVVGPPGPCPVMGVRFRVLVHNTVRGAAGAALLNAELVHASGRLGAVA